MSWPEDAAARLGIPRSEEFTTERVHFPRPTRWGRCGSCGSTMWNLAREGVEAADVMAVHEGFCRGRRP